MADRVRFHVDPKLTEGLCKKTGLTPSAVEELLRNGWRYVERIGEISRWEHPMWSLH